MKRILLTDDKPGILALLRSAFKGRDYEIIEARNGREAFEAAETQIPDLIIMDIMMPEMDGYEACRILKNTPATSEIPVILLTARRQDYDRERGFACGADDYISKPFSPSALVKLTDKYLADPPAGQMGI